MEKLIGMYGRKLQGQTDTNLNINGIEQAKQISEILKSEKIDIIISSPLKRAKKTAEIINEKINVPLEINNGIIERNYGELEGKERQEINFENLWDDEKCKQYDSVEGAQDFYTRVFKSVDDIKEKHKDKNVLLVTHGGVGVPIDSYFKNQSYRESLKENRAEILKNCQFRKYEI